MTRGAARVALVAIVVILGCTALAEAGAAAERGCAGPLAPPRCAHVEPAPSLEPNATKALWRRLVRSASARTFSTEADCRPLRGIFYAAGDWLRLATKLAANASPCAQYYVSIPPLGSDKTQPRPGQAFRIRALGPAFHALAEIHLTSWQLWVTRTGSSWYQAGVEARRRMAAAGYDIAAGDTWALNELSSAVRRGEGTARTDAREFVRGLYEAAGELPAARGVVFMVGVGQSTPDLSTYKARQQEWLQDTAFWTDLGAWVSDWSQEVYGDVRAYAAPGTPLATRRDSLVDYLQHQSLLAGAGGNLSAAALSFLASASSPLANAAWQWETAFGWTFVPYDLMQRYVSGQVYALRYQAATTGQAQDHWGLAWAPRNASGLPPGEFGRQTGEILDRLGAAIRDSAANGDPSDPGSGACGPPGQGVWCVGDLPGAGVSDRWRSFRTWTPPALAFLTAPQSVVAGAVSAPISVQQQIAGVASKPLAPLSITFTSSSPTGTFATSALGPFAPSVTVTLPTAGISSPEVFFQDTRAGAVTVTASTTGLTPATQGITVTGAALAALRIDPSVAAVTLGSTRVFTAVGVDGFGNTVPVASVVWALAAGTPGSLAPAAGPSTTYAATGRTGTGAVTATVTTPAGPVSATAAVTVTPPPVLRVASVRYGVAKRRLHVYVTVVNGSGRRVRTASVTAALYRNGKLYARAAGGTASRGRMVFARPASWGAYRTRVTRIVASGFAWNGKTPVNRFTKPRPRSL
jgi:hypothetical protein